MGKVKLAGVYKRKDGGWLLVNKVYRNGVYKCFLIDIEDDFYDEEIRDLTENEIINIIEDINDVYVPHYNKKFGLYAVSRDGSKPGRIYLQQKGVGR